MGQLPASGSAIAPQLKALAHQGDPTAIATLLSQSLRAKGITAAVRRQQQGLEILLEADEVPHQQAMVDRIGRGLQTLGISPQSVTIHGKRVQDPFPDWSQTITIATASPAREHSSASHPAGFIAQRRSPDDPPGQLAVVPPSPQPTPPLSSAPPSATKQIRPAVPRLTPSVTHRYSATTGLEIKLGNWVLLRLPKKSYRMVMITAIVLGLQIGAVALAVALWGKTTRQTTAYQPADTASPPDMTRLLPSPSRSNQGQYIGNTASPTGTEQVYRAAIKYRQQGIPVIDVTFNGSQTFEMIVDTGASGTLITQPMASSLQVNPVGSVDITIADGSTVRLPAGVLTSISVDGATINNVPVVIAPSMPIGLLGHDFFDGFDIKIKQDVVEFYPR